MKGPELELIRAGLNAILGPDSTGKPGWLQKEGAPTKDVTSSFSSLYAKAQKDQNVLPSNADDYVYLTIDGLTGEHLPGYMEPTREGLSRHGLDVREIPVDTEGSVATNAKVVRDAILEASKGGKQVVLIGHSKGGLDSTAAVALYPELKEHIRAMVAIQSPYGGAPLATDLRSNSVLKAGVKALAEGILHGDENSVRDLTYEERQKFVRAHPWPLDIPTVSLATSTSSQLSVVTPAANYTWLRYGESSDGLVVNKDAEIPGSNVVRLNNLDHLEAVTRVPGEAYDPADLAEVLVALALKAKPAASA